MLDQSDHVAVVTASMSGGLLVLRRLGRLGGTPGTPSVRMVTDDCRLALVRGRWSRFLASWAGVRDRAELGFEYPQRGAGLPPGQGSAGRGVVIHALSPAGV